MHPFPVPLWPWGEKTPEIISFSWINSIGVKPQAPSRIWARLRHGFWIRTSYDSSLALPQEAPNRHLLWNTIVAVFRPTFFPSGHHLFPFLFDIIIVVIIVVVCWSLLLSVNACLLISRTLTPVLHIIAGLRLLSRHERYPQTFRLPTFGTTANIDYLSGRADFSYLTT